MAAQDVTSIDTAAPAPALRGTRRERTAGANHAPWLVALTVLTAVVALPILIRLSAGGDIAAHGEIAVRLMQEGQWFSYSLWYPVIYAAAGGASADAESLRVAAVVLLTLATLATSLLSYRFAWLVTRSAPKAFAVAGVLLLAMPLVDPWRPRSIYMGQVSPTVWHNSTNIFVLPLAILAFTSGLALLRQPSRRRALVFGVVATVMLMAKPNFALALLPVVGIFLAVGQWRRGTRIREIAALASLAFVLPAAILVGQYVVVFISTWTGLGRGGLAFAPLEVWSRYSPNVAWSLVLSIAGPVVATVVLRRGAPWEDARWLAWSVFAVALGQMAFLAESSSKGIASSGNWFWGAFTAAFILFMVVASELAATRHTGWRKVVAAVAAVLFLGHAVSGAVYVARAGVDGFPVTMDHEERESG